MNRDEYDYRENPNDPETEYEKFVLGDFAAKFGFRVMHRRNGQYWLMFEEPMTVPDIDYFLTTGRIAQRAGAYMCFNPYPELEDENI